MSLKEQIEAVVPEGCAVGETRYVEPVTGREMTTYAVNARGVVLQYSIGVEDEQNPGIAEDFIEDIIASVKEVTRL